MCEPGKINLNTATESAWKALIGNDNRTNWPPYSSTPDSLYELRQGTSVLPLPLPTEFAAPFRSPQAANLVPPLTMPAFTGNEDELVQSSPIDTTLLRKNSSGVSFIEPNLSSGDSTNPYTALENIMRLSDMTTTRSNVFAVWITIGYFEVDQFAKANLGNNSPTDDLFKVYPSVVSHFPDGNGSSGDKDFFEAVYPDGYVLKTEKGLDNGTVQRHRAFYLIDRSTPVGFRRGNSPNYKDVIVQSKILE